MALGRGSAWASPPGAPAAGAATSPLQPRAPPAGRPARSQHRPGPTQDLSRLSRRPCRPAAAGAARLRRGLLRLPVSSSGLVRAAGPPGRRRPARSRWPLCGRGAGRVGMGTTGDSGPARPALPAPGPPRPGCRVARARAGGGHLFGALWWPRGLPGPLAPGGRSRWRRCRYAAHCGRASVRPARDLPGGIKIPCPTTAKSLFLQTGPGRRCRGGRRRGSTAGRVCPCPCARARVPVPVCPGGRQGQNANVLPVWAPGRCLRGARPRPVHLARAPRPELPEPKTSLVGGYLARPGSVVAYSGGRWALRAQAVGPTMPGTQACGPQQVVPRRNAFGFKKVEQAGGVPAPGAKPVGRPASGAPRPALLVLEVDRRAECPNR